jgi:hypothetical protein
MRSSGIISAGTEMTAPDLPAMLRIDCDILREPEYKIQRNLHGSVPQTHCEKRVGRGFGRRYRPEPRKFMGT